MSRGWYFIIDSYPRDCSIVAYRIIDESSKRCWYCKESYPKDDIHLCVEKYKDDAMRARAYNKYKQKEPKKQTIDEPKEQELLIIITN